MDNMSQSPVVFRQPADPTFWWDGEQWSKCRARVYYRAVMTGQPEFFEVNDGWVKGIFFGLAHLPSHVERLQGSSAAPVAPLPPTAGRPALAAGAALLESWPDAKSAPLFLATKPCSFEVMGFGTSVETARADAVHAALEQGIRDRRRPDVEAASRVAADLLVFQLVDGQL